MNMRDVLEDVNEKVSPLLAVLWYSADKMDGTASRRMVLPARILQPPSLQHRPHLTLHRPSSLPFLTPPLTSFNSLKTSSNDIRSISPTRKSKLSLAGHPSTN